MRLSQASQRSARGVAQNWADMLRIPVDDFASSTTFHGVSRLWNESVRALRAFWALCILTCILYCMYQVVLTVVSFYKYQTTSVTLLRSEMSVAFPAISFCNMQPFDARRSDARTDPILDRYYRATLVTGTARDFVDNLNRELNNLIRERHYAGTRDYQFDLAEMLISCKFNRKPCTLDDFDYFYNHNFGACFRFNNRRQLRSVNRVGWRNGLQMELFVGQTPLHYKSGVIVVVHDQQAVPFPNDDGIEVATGQQTNVGIVRSHINTLSEPFHNCLGQLEAKNDLLDIMLNRHNLTQYSQKYCIKLCFQAHVNELCECTDVGSPVIKTKLDACLNRTQLACVSSATGSFLGAPTELCYQKCPIACNKIQFDKTISFADYPTDWYAQLLGRNEHFRSLANLSNATQQVEFGAIKRSILMLNVFYADLLVAQIDEYPQLTSDTLLGIIGGNMGFFLGASMLSFIEILVMFIKMGIAFVKRFINIK